MEANLARADDRIVEINVAYWHRLCEDSDVELARRNFVSITLNRKRTAVAIAVEGGTREKTILRILCARTFSHGLGTKRTCRALWRMSAIEGSTDSARISLLVSSLPRLWVLILAISTL